MIRAIFIIFTLLTIGSIYLTYQGVGLQEVESIENPPPTPTVRSSSSSNYGGSSSYSGGYSFGK
jgi:hypothetical protein